MRPLLLAAALSACGASSTVCDLSTDEGGKAAAHRLVPEAKDCIERSPTFQIDRVGAFANDRGCIWQHVIAECALDPKSFEPRAMARAGWADPAKRERLARAWLVEVDATEILTTAPESWTKAGKTLDPPTAAAGKDGGIELRYWTVAPAGMTVQRSYRQFSTPFSADGAEGQSTELAHVEL